ncbi:hypothetical protein SARC_17734, partial [Sphaeroforma arctica JP610]
MNHLGHEEANLRVQLTWRFQEQGHPAPAVAVQQMRDDGHNWDQMLPITEEVRKLCRTCLGNDTMKKGFHPLINITARYLWGHIQMYLIPMAVTSTKGNKFFLHVLDVASGYSSLRAIPATDAKTVAA